MVKDCGGWSLAGVLGDVEIEYSLGVIQFSLRVLAKIP